MTDLSFFDFDSLSDSWGKVLRDHARLRAEVNTDTILNFFIGAYHVMEWVKVLPSVSAAALDEVKQDRDFELCRFICNRGKHVVLNKDPGYSAHADVAVAKSRYAVIVGEERIDVLDLADAVVSRWRRFFQENALSVEAGPE